MSADEDETGLHLVDRGGTTVCPVDGIIASLVDGACDTCGSTNTEETCDA